MINANKILMKSDPWSIISAVPCQTEVKEDVTLLYQVLETDDSGKNKQSMEYKKFLFLI